MSRKNIIAVGYELDSQSIEEFKKNVILLCQKKSNSGKTLNDKFPDFNIDDFVFQSKILSGVFYLCPPVGDKDCQKNTNEMISWYEKHKLSEYIFIDSFHFHYSTKKNGEKNPLFIIATCHNISGNRFYSFLSNMSSGITTTCHKRNIRNGIYSGPITFDTPIKVYAKPYLYER